MLNNRTTAQSAAVPKPVSHGDGSDESPSCALAALAALFQPQRVAPPHPSIALRPMYSLGRSREANEDEDEEGEGPDYVVETLRAAPPSIFRGPPASSSSSGSGQDFLPARLELLSSSAARRSTATATPSKEKRTLGSAASGKASASPCTPAAAATDALSSLTSVLSMLSCVLQRSPAAYSATNHYNRLVQLLLDHGFVARAAEDMAELWRRCGVQAQESATVSSAAQARAFTTLALYCDVLLLLAYHCLSAEKDEDDVGNAAHAPSDSSHALTTTTTTASRSFTSAVSTSLLQMLYTFNQKMGATLVEGTSTAAATVPRRCVASLTAFLILCAPQLPQEVAEAALCDLENGDARGVAARSNMAHMAFIAALPTACPSMPPEWQNRALDVVRKATLYDVDLHVAYSADGPAAVTYAIAAAQFSGAVRGLLSIMSDLAWCFCTADALVHVCHAVAIYGGSWESHPASYSGLVNFLQQALVRHYLAYEKASSASLLRDTHAALAGAEHLPASGHAAAIVEANRRGSSTATAPRLLGPSVESLLDHTVLGAAEGEKDASRAALRRDDGQVVVPSFTEEADKEGGESGADTPMDYLVRCEAAAASPRSFPFYLALLAYVTSALPPLLTSFAELPRFFTLSLSQSSSSSPSAAGTVAALDGQTDAALPVRVAADVPLFALCLDHLRAYLTFAVGSSSSSGSADTSRDDTQRRLLCEAAVSLLTSFMCEFPHSIQRLEKATGTHHLVETVRDVVLAILGTPRASYEMRRAAYALLHRYSTAVESIGAVVTRLLHPAAWATLSNSSNSAYVQADYYDVMRLYRHLCASAEYDDGVELSFALTTLAGLPAGVFSRGLGGAALAAAAVHSVFDLREECGEDEKMLFAAVTVPQLPALCSRLGEAVDTLLQAQRHGCWVAAGRSTWQSTHVAGWLLHKAVTMYRVPAALATVTFPVMRDDDGAATDDVVYYDEEEEASRQPLRNVLVACLAVLCDTHLNGPHRAMAELIAAALQASAEQQRSQEVFQAVRGALSQSGADHLREIMLAVQKRDIGTVSNALRLEVWLAMARWCPALFVFIFGPKSQRGTAEEDADREGEKEGDRAASEQPENLPFAKVLGFTVRSGDASLTEKALALQVLRHTELFSVVSVREVVALLPKDRTDKEASEATRAATDAALLAAACATYVNAVIAGQLSKAKTAAVDGKAAEGGQSGERAGQSTTSGDAPTPLHRPSLTPLSQPSAAPGVAAASPVTAARCKVLASHTDTVDQLLRHVPVLLERCRDAYERESRDVLYEDVSEWMARHTDMNASDFSGDGISASVVLPRRQLSSTGHNRSGGNNNSRTISLMNWSNTIGDGGSLSRHHAPMALATAASRVSATQYSNAAVAPLLVLDGDSSFSAPFLELQRLIPIGAAEARFFRGTGDDARLNTLATLLDTAAGVMTVTEQLLWCSAVDTNAAGLFQKRTQALLECAVRAVVSSRPNSPLLAPLLARHVRAALRLATAATGVLESSLSADVVEVEVSASMQHALLQLAAFVKGNRHHRSLVVDALPLVTAFPLTSVAEQTAVEALLREAQAMLHDQLNAPNDGDACRTCDAVVEGCRRYFSRQRSDSGAVDVVLLSRLLPTLLRYLSLLAQGIQPTQPACPNAHRFASVTACISCILVQGGNHAAVLGFLSEDALLGFTRALGQFALPSVFDHVTHCHHRLSWHVCWHAMLSLWAVVVSLGGPCSAKAAGWLPSLTAALESVPRFASAISVFAGHHGGANRGELLVWKIEEADVATRLAAALAVQDVPLAALLPCVQAGFLFMQQPRLQKLCVASVPTAEASASEGRRIAAAQAHVLRNALTVLLKQPHYAVPRDGTTQAAFVFPPELTGDAAPPPQLLRGAAASSTDSSESFVFAKALVYSLDLLRQYTVRELQLLRRLTAGSSGASLERSPDAGRPSAGSTASRESSVTRSPSRGPMGDAETVTEMGDELYTADGALVEDASDQQAVHLEVVQLALSAYALTVEDLVDNAPSAPGELYTPAVLQAIRHATERLLHTLGRLAHEVRDLRRPLLSHIVQTKTQQLTAVLKRL